jgi:hypothetical protein
MSSLDRERIANSVLAHGESAISILVELITIAVRASQDEHVAVLDRVLQDVERMTDTIRQV